MHIDFTKVFATVQKGLSVIHTLVEQGKQAGPAIIAVKNLVASAQGGKVTETQIASTETALDALIDEFNEPMK